MIEEQNSNWQQSTAPVFWGEIAPCSHVVQIYENDEIILDALEEFVVGGIKADESVVVIATQAHLHTLNERLRSNGLNPLALQLEDQYIPLNAEETLSKFMVNGWPDDEKFTNTVKEVITRARGKNGRKVRAYGEMVAILWAEGNSGATVNLEHLWHSFCMNEAFCLFCAYPKSGFTQDISKSISNICSTHSKVISGARQVKGEVHYINID